MPWTIAKLAHGKGLQEELCESLALANRACLVPGATVGSHCPAAWQKETKCCGCAGPMYQAGTLSGNPLAMVAGIKTLEILARPGAYEHLDAVTGRLINGLLEAGRAAGHALCGGHISGVPLDVSPHSVRDTHARWHCMEVHTGELLVSWCTCSEFSIGFPSLAELRAWQACLDSSSRRAR